MSLAPPDRMARSGRARFAEPVDLADPALRSLILRLAVPMVIGLVINALYYAVDAAFLGHYSTGAMAAVNLVLPVFGLVCAVGEGIGVGTAAALGRLLGERRWGRASVSASTGLALATALGAVLTVVLWLGREHVVSLLGASPTIAPMAEAYLGILALSCLLTLPQILCDFIAIAEGNTRFSMYTLLVSFCLNIVLDPIFIFVFDMGVEGAAVATLLAKVAALAAYAVYFAAHWGHVRVHVRFVYRIGSVVRPMLSVGTPAMLASLITAVAFAILYRQAAVVGGEAGLAAVGISSRLLMLGNFPVIGFCVGAQAVLSFSHGARDYQRLLSGLWFMLAVTTAFAVVYSLVMVTFPRTMASLFTNDPTVLDDAAEAVRMFHLASALTGLEFVVLVLLQSLGRGALSAVVGLAPQGYLLIPLLLILPMSLGFHGLLWSTPLATGLSGVLTMIIFLMQTSLLRRRVAAAPSRPPLPQGSDHA